MELLTDSFKIDQNLIYYLPFLIDDLHDAEIDKHKPFNERHHFMTIGNFIHEPNYDALKYLKDILWKPIKKALPNAKLHNYGAYASQKVNQLHNEREGFHIKGFTDDVDESMQSYKVLLAPLRFGAGLKGKMFDAMRNGLPFVTTSIGIEGLMDKTTLVNACDDPQDFIQEAIKLYSDVITWESQKSSGYELLRTKFSKYHFEQGFEERLNQLKITYKTERQQNFIGQMLQYHNLQSTKYMSKWIELKNKNRS